MEHKSNCRHHNSGFILGLVVGGILTLLFTTKKGREMLRTIIDGGLEKVSELEDLLTKEQNTGVTSLEKNEQDEDITINLQQMMDENDEDMDATKEVLKKQKTQSDVAGLSPAQAERKEKAPTKEESGHNDNMEKKSKPTQESKKLSTLRRFFRRKVS